MPSRLVWAERMTGLVIEVSDAGKPYFADGTTPHCESLIIAKGETKSDALKELVALVFKLNREAALKRDKYTCVRCGRRGNVEVHHIIHRSRGGTHQMDNLETVCASFTGCGFHHREHGGI